MDYRTPTRRIDSEYGGNVRVKVFANPVTVVVTGAIFVGVSNEFSSSGSGDERTVSCPVGATRVAPVVSERGQRPASKNGPYVVSTTP
ncbi:MAG TPA: hypothetical protein VES67_06065 [Vicinamibacterales bacterium]|nr:hypothetical protein [Vicinamibacterales bacterium]